MRRRVLCAALALSLVGLGGAGFVAYDWIWGAESEWRAAQEAVKRHDFEQASRHIEAYLKAKPDKAEAHLLAAQVLRRAVQPRLGGEDDDFGDAKSARGIASAGSFEKADQHLRDYKRLGGVPELLLEERYLLRAQQGDLKEIEGELWAWVEHDHPDKALILEALAKGYVLTYRLQAAAQTLDRLLGIEESPQTLALRGWLAFRYLKYDRAVELYRKVLELDPENEDAQLRLASILRISAKPQEALTHFEHLWERRPGDREVAFGLAETYLALGRPEARPIIDEWLAEEPDNAFAMLLRAKVEWKDRHAANAEAWVRKSLAKRCWDREANQLLIQCLGQRGAKEELKEAQARLDNLEVEFGRLEDVTRLIVASREDPKLRWEAGALLICTGQPRGGVRWLRTALALDPQHQPTRQLLADYDVQGGSSGSVLYRHAHAALADYYKTFSEPRYKALAEYHLQASRAAEQTDPPLTQRK